VIENGGTELGIVMVLKSIWRIGINRVKEIREKRTERILKRIFRRARPQ
jgi:hypothetical protein